MHYLRAVLTTYVANNLKHPQVVPDGQENADVRASAKKQQQDAIRAAHATPISWDGRMFALSYDGEKIFDTAATEEQDLLRRWEGLALHLASMGVSPGQGVTGEDVSGEFYYALPFPAWRWVVFITVPATKFNHTVRQLRLMTLCFSVTGCLVAVVLITWFFRRNIILPVRHLLSAMEVLASGRSQVEIPIYSRDELGTLARGIERMTRKFHANEEELEVFYKFAEASGIGFSFSALDGRIMFANQALERLLGVVGATLTHRSLREFFPREWRLRLGDEIFPVILSDGQWSGEMPLLRSDGVSLPAYCSFFLICDAKGDPLYFAAAIMDMSEHKALEHRLREGEKRIRAIMDSLPVGVLVVEAGSHTIVDTNPAGALLLGLEKEALLGAQCHQFFASCQEGACPAAEYGGKETTVESCLITASGEQKPVWKTVQPLWLEDKAYLIESVVDISDRKQAENALLESERFATKIVEFSMSGLFIYDLESQEFITINPQFTEITGYTLPLLATQAGGLFGLLHPDEHTRMREHLELLRTTSENTVLEVEYRLRTRSGRWIWCLTRNAAFLHDERGEVRQFISNFLDITERKEVERKLQEHHDRLEQMVEERTSELKDANARLLWQKEEASRKERVLRVLMNAIPESVILMDREGRILEANETVLGRFNTSLETLRGSAKYEFISRVLPENRLGEIQAALEGKNARTFEDERCGRYSYNHLHPVVNDNGDVEMIATLGIDITEHKLLEQQLEARNDELARSNEELQHFAYVASHDLQEPLRMVRSFMDLLSKRYGDQLDERAQTYIAYAKDGATRMREHIQGLLEYSRVRTRASEFKEVRMEEVLANVLRHNQILFRESNAEVTHDPLPALPGDELQLERLVQNLLLNAVKFKNEDPPQIHIGVEEGPEKWIFSVKDNGIGIPKSNQERIFKLFQRLHTRDQYPGSGIGLAVCQRIVERHSGQIWVESTKGEGSVFYFSLRKYVGFLDCCSL